MAAGSVEEFLAAVDVVITEHRAEVEPALLLAELVRNVRSIVRHLDGLEARMAHDDGCWRC